MDKNMHSGKTMILYCLITPYAAANKTAWTTERYRQDWVVTMILYCLIHSGSTCSASIAGKHQDSRVPSRIHQLRPHKAKQFITWFYNKNKSTCYLWGPHPCLHYCRALELPKFQRYCVIRMHAVTVSLQNQNNCMNCFTSLKYI